MPRVQVVFRPSKLRVKLAATSRILTADARSESRLDTGAVQYGWSGGSQRAISGIGLILMGARVYNVATGRFTSSDVIPRGNENAYNYPNDPINVRDITGMVAVVIVGLGLALADLVLLALQFLLIVFIFAVVILVIMWLVQQLIVALNTRASGKEKENDVPSWARGAKILAGESITQALIRTYAEAGKPLPPDNKKGPNSEWSKITKFLTQRWNDMQKLIKSGK